jgi:hypothetical protein
LPKQTAAFDSKFKADLIEEAEHFNLIGLKNLLIGLHDVNSLILKGNKLHASFQHLVKDKTQLKNKQWTLLYRATEDGFDAADFHRKCDNKGATLTIIKTRDHPNVLYIKKFRLK